MSTLTAERTWMDRAACTDPQEMSIPDECPKAVQEAAKARAKKICATCPVLAECRHWALTEEYPLVGIVAGGLSPNEQRKMRQLPEYRAVWMAKRQRARCGTPAGYALHCRTGTTICDACKDAYRRISRPNGSTR